MRNGSVQLGLDGRFDGVVELLALGREELDAVVVVRVVRGGDDDAGVGAQRTRQVAPPPASASAPACARRRRRRPGRPRARPRTCSRRCACPCRSPPWRAPFPALRPPARGRRRCPGAARNRRRSGLRRPVRGCRRCRSTFAMLMRPIGAGRGSARHGLAHHQRQQGGQAVAHLAAVDDQVDRAVLDQELASAGSLRAASRARSVRSRAGRRSRSAPAARPR